MLGIREERPFLAAERRWGREDLSFGQHSGHSKPSPLVQDDRYAPHYRRAI
jgi:hypothetical protein